jgi:Uma2 family endonuclease
MSCTDTLLRPSSPAPKHERYRWTLEQLERMIEHGIFGENDRVELVDGELYRMSPKGIRHENVRAEIQDWLIDNKPKNSRLYSEPGWRPDGKSYCEPDFILAPSGSKPFNVDPKEVLLLIEIARSSWAYDTTLKASHYARLGVREYWVVHAHRLVTKVHLKPARQGYKSTVEHVASDALEATLIPGLSVRLDSLDLD